MSNIPTPVPTRLPPMAENPSGSFPQHWIKRLNPTGWSIDRAFFRIHKSANGPTSAADKRGDRNKECLSGVKSPDHPLHGDHARIIHLAALSRENPGTPLSAGLPMHRLDARANGGLDRSFQAGFRSRGKSPMAALPGHALPWPLPSNPSQAGSCIEAPDTGT